uniref:HLA class II histocompatibility antigen, DRB1-11 beta chain n=1 Tax=Lygus hesperus TaxID=30085 RepID=A0A0A9WHQ9_LYGHE
MELTSHESNEEIKRFKLAMSRYHKKCLYRLRYPDLYKDNGTTKAKVRDRVFANQDYIHKNVHAPTFRKIEQLKGGITKPLELPWNFNFKTDEEDMVELATACEMRDAVFRPSFALDDKRSHIRFVSPGKVMYVPLMHNVISTPSLPGSYHVSVNRSFIRPNFTFVKDSGQAMKMWVLHMAGVDCQRSSIHFNPGFLNLRLLAPEMRDTIIRHLAKTFKKQQNLTTLTFEHAFLDSTDALRVLASAALGSGHTLQKLYLCNLFFPKSLPLQTEFDDFDVHDELEYDPVNQPVYSEEMKSEAWNKLFEKPLFDQMPPVAIDYHFRMALSSLSKLTVLMVNYSWLSKGNGLYLLQLECIRNASLRKLILVVTPSEDTNESRQAINDKAWALAVRMCPCLELHLLLFETAAFIDLKQVLVRSMPLISIHFSNTYLLEDVGKRKPWSFSYFARYLNSYFSYKLEVINITVRHPSCMVDSCLGKMIMKCELLRVFLYRGPVDKFDSVREIFDFLLRNNNMRIREIRFSVADDPCRPIGWTEAVNDIKDKYTTPLAVKGITMSIDIWKL